MTDVIPKKYVDLLRIWKVRIDFDPKEFNRAIDQVGMRLLWEKVSLCPCRNNDETEQPQVGCSVCDGDGWEYWGAQLVNGIVGALDLDQDTQVAFGIWASGMAQITVKNEHKPDFRDRYTHLDSLLRYTQHFKRSGVQDRLRYYIGVMPLALAPEEYVLAASGDPEAVLAAELAANAISRAQADIGPNFGVLRLRLRNADLSAGAVLEPGIDFDVVDGLVDWARGDVRGTAPTVGQSYSVSYLFHPRHIVNGFNHAVRDSWVKFKSPIPLLNRLPIEVNCRLDYLPQPGEGA